LGWVVAYCSLALVPFAAFAFSMELILSLRLGRHATYANFLSTAILAVASLLLLTLWQATALAMLAAFAIAYTIPVLWNGRRLAGLAQELPADRQTLPWSATWLSMLPIIFTFWLADFLGNFFYLIDRYMLINLLDEASETVLSQIGNYEAAQVLPLVYLAVTGWIAKTLMPYLAKSWETGAREDVISQVLFSIKLVGFGSVFSGLLLVGFSDGLFTLLFAGKYGAAVPLLPYTILFYIGCGTTTLLMNYFWCIGQARWAMLALVVGCLANVGINWVAIPPHGILGAAWGTTCGIIGQVLVLLAVAWVFGLRADLGVGLLGLSTLLLFTPEQWIFASLMGLVVALALPGVWVADDRRRIRAAAEKIFARFSPSR
jgi:O-antigen/teichoic acid export membrane protein